VPKTRRTRSMWAELMKRTFAFARAQPRLRAILLNGRKTEQGFLRTLGGTALPARITVRVLPSTSPANTRRDKLDT